MTITSMPAVSNAPGQFTVDEDLPDVPVPPPAPTPVVMSDQLKLLSAKLTNTFETYKRNRILAEQRWLRHQRQMLGIYDPEVESTLAKDRSRAYPRITRAKVYSVTSKLMDLMFPGNEENWDIKASPSPEMDPDMIDRAIQDYIKKQQEAGVPVQITGEVIEAAVQELADTLCEKLKVKIKDQLQELGGDQTYDYIQLNRRAVISAATYGLGVITGPYVKEERRTQWQIDPVTQQPFPGSTTVYKPAYEFLPIWDFYPDMTAKTMRGMDGYFIRKILTRSQVRKLADRSDYFGEIIKKYLATHTIGNYKAQTFEQDLRTMGTKSHVNDQDIDGSKYEIVTWHGPISAQQLMECGVQIPEDFQGDDVEAEIVMLDDVIIKAQMNAWRILGADLSMIHFFIFDEDDTSPIGNGVPHVMRDSQMMVSNATRMLLDNASVVCGPILEMLEKLLRVDQDRSSIHAYKIFYRDDEDPATAQWPAIRQIKVDSHISELLQIIDLGLKFADMETFVGPATGGDMDNMPSEPFRTAAGASMLRGEQALPFKDIVRNFDSMTQSIIYSIVQFNKKFNPGEETQGDFNVIARGATSLIAKEIRGVQLDQLAVTLTDKDRNRIDEDKLLKERLATRDAEHLMLSETEANRRRQQEAAAGAEQQDMIKRQTEATIRELLSGAFKNITQGQKNAAAADAEAVNSMLAVLEKSLNAGQENQTEGSGKTTSG